MEKSGWKEYCLSEIIEIISGGTPKTNIDDYWNGSIPWLSVKDFNNPSKYVYSTEKTITKLGLENSATQLLQKDDIIISARGTVGVLAMIPFPMTFNQSCYGIRANSNKVECHFLYYLLNYRLSEIKNNTHGSVFDTITRDTFNNISVQIPPLPTQQKIASILSALDDKIELNQKINDNLEKQAQALFKSWFVDFEPFKDGEFIESELGMIPKGWRISNLLKIADYLNGLAMQKFRPESDEIGIPVLKIKELRQGFCDNNSDLCSPNIANEYIVNNGDVIFSWSGSLLVDLWCGERCGLNQHLFKVTSENYPKWFYLFWTKHHLDNFIRIANDKAVTMGHIKRGDLKKSLVLIPNNEVSEKANNILQPIIEQIIENKIASFRLSEVRDTLLPKLMSGEISVEEIEI